MNKKIAFFDSKPYDKKSFINVNQEFGFDITYFEAHLNQQTVALSEGFDAVCSFVNDTVDEFVIDRLVEYDIKILGLRCAGFNSVDLKAADNKVNVVRVPAYSPYAVAEHATALMLSLNRKVHRAHARTHDGNFSINGLLGFDMHGKTAGVIGTGRIGKCLISILKGFGMNILAFDLYPDEAYAQEVGIRYASLDEIYETVDILSLHCPLTEESWHMIDFNNIDKMKDGMMIINTSRGKLINTLALIKGLKSRKIGAAGLDVYEEENDYFFEDRSEELIIDDMLARLLTFPNVLITSHQAFFTQEALNNIALTTLSNFQDFFENGSLKNKIFYKENLSV